MARQKKNPSKTGISAASVEGPKNPGQNKQLRDEPFRQSSNNQQFKRD
ncbi:YuzL family protein [Bacillus solimangrovi]|nr:YuzL family protein [Bacillus solimangrovi]